MTAIDTLNEHLPKVRRVTTGINDQGRSVVVQDEIVERKGGALVLWAADTPRIAGDATPPVTNGWWPPPGGVRVTLSTRAPEKTTVAKPAEGRAWPDINDAAGFHASNSVDVLIIISGRLWLELDDGVEVELGAGDTVVQNGARHKWHNHSDEWPLMACVIVGAEPA